MKYSTERIRLFLAALGMMAGAAAAWAEPIPVKHPQGALHQFMVARSDDGKVLGRAEFSQTVQGDEVTMRLTYHFVDGSTDDEMTTYRQQGTFRLIRDHHVQKGPFFGKDVDFAVEAATGIATTRTADKNGQVHVESEHMDLPDDLANGFVGTLLTNVPHNTAPFRMGLLVPFNGGRVIRILISPEGEQSFQMAGQTLRAAVFRVHPEIGGMAGLFAPLAGLQPKDVMVWVVEGNNPDVVRVVGQLGGSGPVISSDLEGASFGK